MQVITKAKIKINGREIEAQQGETILETAKKNNIHIPTLCYHEDICLSGVCRICVVDIEGQRLLLTSCSTPVVDGMVINTHSRRVRKARKMIIELLLSEHVADCQTCKRNLNCELQTLASEYGIDEERFKKADKKKFEIDDLSPIVRDNDKCILCRRCVSVCEEIQGVEAIKAMGRGTDTTIGSIYNLPLNSTFCVFCGQCII
ncbi:MAG: (2Fe-2S)-binding protein, partial [Candidatus Aenigmarchaeota archaeon]|nr:(2Fe-2S)-binding protein [Candidatus Aenigmarchaeota archaeon]